ncbi:12897_t:CDS:2, partial [Ambispora leptoticha]
MVGKCPGCGWIPKTGKTRDLNKHMDLTRNRLCQALLQLSHNTQPIPQVTVLDSNARKSGESVKQWGSRLRKRLKEVIYQDYPQPQNLFQCKHLYDQLLQVDPEAYVSEKPLMEEEKCEEQGFFDEPEIEEANLQHDPSPMVQPEINPEAGPGPQTQAHREGRLTESEEIVTQTQSVLLRRQTPSDNTELQSVQELLDHKDKFLDLDIEVPWPVPYPDNKEHCVIWQNGIRTAKDMFKIDLASIILRAENEDKAMQEVFLQCLFRNYSEEEINETIKLAVDAYRAFENEDEAIQGIFLQCLYCNYSEKEINETIKLAVNKGYKNWLRYVEDQIESKKIEAGMTEKRAQRILDTIDNHEYLIRVKFIRDDTVISDKGTKKGFKIIDKYEPIRESKKAGGKYVGGGPN